MEPFLYFWKRLVLLGFVIMATSVDEGDFVYSAASSDWSLSPNEEYVTAWLNVTYMDGDKLHTEKAEIGKFGTGKVGLASGLVVHVTSGARNNTHFGCDFPYGNQLPTEPWIALVKRGNCTFDEKLKNAYRSNASALVVYAKDEKDTLDRMNFKDCSYCNIPAVFTHRWKGEEIAKVVDRGTRVYMYITVGETVARPYSGINRTSVLFVSISFIVLMIISLAWLVFYYVQRFRYLHAKDRLAQRLCNAAKKALAKIPTRNIKLTDKDLSGDGECCAVCIELYRSGETLRTLPCRHEFHKLCVDPWLLEHRTCPMCKMDILKYYGYIFTGSQESILHLDMEEGVLNSSESRETESPFHDNQRHQQRQLPGSGGSAPPTSNPTNNVSTDQIDQRSSYGVHLRSEQVERNPSMVSVTVVSFPKASQSIPETVTKSSAIEPADDGRRSLSACSLSNDELQGSPKSTRLSPEEVIDPSLNIPEQSLELTNRSRTFQEVNDLSDPLTDSKKCVPVTVHQFPPAEATLPHPLHDCNMPALPRSQSADEEGQCDKEGKRSTGDPENRNP